MTDRELQQEPNRSTCVPLSEPTYLGLSGPPELGPLFACYP